MVIPELSVLSAYLSVLIQKKFLQLFYLFVPLLSLLQYAFGFSFGALLSFYASQ